MFLITILFNLILLPLLSILEMICSRDKHKRNFVDSRFCSKKLSALIEMLNMLWKWSSKKLSTSIDRIKMLCECSNRKRKLSAAGNKECMRRRNACKRHCANTILLPRNIITMMRNEGGIELKLIGRNVRKRTSVISIKWFLFLMEAIHTGSLLFCIIWVILM
jgi:hypothetical protein